MDENKREKQKLLEVARKSKDVEKKCFTQPQKEIDTYFVEREAEDYIQEYGFKSMPELKVILENTLQIEDDREELIRIISIATFKNRYNNSKKQVSSKQLEESTADSEKLPGYIYNM